MKKTIRFLITGVGGQGTILASDILAEVGLRLGHDAKKSDILGLAVRGGSVVSHIIWGDKRPRAHDRRGTADYYISFEWLEGCGGSSIRIRIRSCSPTTGASIPCRSARAGRISRRGRHPRHHPRTLRGPAGNPGHPLAVDMGNARVFNSVIMGGLALLVGGRRRRLALRRRRHGSRPRCAI